MDVLDDIPPGLLVAAIDNTDVPYLPVPPVDQDRIAARRTVPYPQKLDFVISWHPRSPRIVMHPIWVHL